MQHLRDSLLVVMHLLKQLGEVSLVLDLWVREQRLVQGADEEQDLAPVDVLWVSDLLLARLPALILRLV